MCRTANGWDINGFGQLKDGRGNICPVTIIMPTLAMMAKEINNHHFEDFQHPDHWSRKDYDNVETFMTLLDEKIHEAKDMLIERFEWICAQSPDSAKFMYENGNTVYMELFLSAGSFSEFLNKNDYFTNPLIMYSHPHFIVFEINGILK